RRHHRCGAKHRQPCPYSRPHFRCFLVHKKSCVAVFDLRGSLLRDRPDRVATAVEELLAGTCGPSRATFGMRKLLVLLALLVAELGSARGLRFEVSADTNLITSPATGRLLVILDRLSPPEPRFGLHPGETDVPFFVGRDVVGFASGQKVIVDPTAAAF